MKHLLLILIALLFCQCTNKKNDALLEIKEIDLKSASNLNGNLNCSKELEHYAS